MLRGTASASRIALHRQGLRGFNCQLYQCLPSPGLSVSRSMSKVAFWGDRATLRLAPTVCAMSHSRVPADSARPAPSVI